MNQDNKKEERVVLTEDRRVASGSKRTPADEDMFTGPYVEISSEMLRTLAEAAAELSEAFEKEAKKIMTPERAAFVRRLRCEEDHTWRAVAQACYDAWSGDWAPPSNQLMGIALCEAASEHFGENAYEAPWN